jgi:VanZ family protein
VKSPTFNAYALVALCTAIVRECAVEKVFIPAKVAGLTAVIVDLVGLPADDYAELAAAVAS